MNKFEQEKKELKEKTRHNIEFDKAVLGTYAIAFLGMMTGGIAGTVQKIAEDPKDIEGYIYLPALLVIYYVFVLGNRVVGGLAPQTPDEHLQKYKQELKVLYKVQQLQQQKKTK